MARTLSKPQIEETLTKSFADVTETVARHYFAVDDYYEYITVYVRGAKDIVVASMVGNHSYPDVRSAVDDIWALITSNQEVL